jgi:hypothetical protein
MEELVVLIIRLIERMLSPKPPASPQRRIPTQPPALPRGVVPSRAPVTKKMPSARRGRRSPPPIAIAAPLFTAAPAPAATSLPPMVPMQRTQAKAIVPTTPTHTAPALDAASLRRWLTPVTLRQQYLLTEILQPPLALRDKVETHR